MYNPARIDLRIDKGTSIHEVFRLKNSDGTAFDLTGYTVISHAEDIQGSTVLDDELDLHAEITDYAGGEITIQVDYDATTSADIPGVTTGLRDEAKPIWDVVITDSDTIRTKIIYGLVDVYHTVSTE